MDELYWARLYENEARAREIVAEKRESNKKSDKDLRAWWKSISSLLEAISIAEGRQEIRPEPFMVLARVTDELSRGVVSQLFTHVDTRGAPGAVWREVQDIRLAVAYLRAAKGELVHNRETVFVLDKSPTKRVSEAFGVSRRTVREWAQEHKPAEFGKGPLTPDIVTKKMLAAGDRYRIAGRSREAIRARAAPK